MPIKNFANGYPLPASDINTYLMNQTVMTFASSTARASGITAPTEGMLTWLEDSNKYQYYTGSAWADLLPDTSAMVTLTGTQTLTNKTLTAPVIATISNTGTLTLPSSTDTLVGRATTDTLTNKTLTSPTISGGTNSISQLVSPLELITISATAATGTVNLDASTQAILYYTTNASANHTLNVRGNSGTTLNSIMATGQTITVTFMNTNGTTAYYPTVYQIDGSAVTPKWLGGTAPSGGNASAIDIYTLTIIKTGTAAFTVLASQTKAA